MEEVSKKLLSLLISLICDCIIIIILLLKIVIYLFLQLLNGGVFKITTRIHPSLTYYFSSINK